MIWIAFVGIILEVVGLGIAVTGLADTHREATDRSLWKDLRADGRQRLRRVLRRPGSAQVIHGSAASIGIALTSDAYGTVRRPAPAADATIEERVDHLDAVVADALDEIVAVRTHATSQLAEARQHIERQIREVDDRARQTDREVRDFQQAMIGTKGSGLRLAAFGLMVTGAGVLLSICGLFT
jgi:ElaB/YqjD/DUF883 family membrane-anchored ribosome-binding protein